jgi:cytochrome c oxidase subunit 3
MSGTVHTATDQIKATVPHPYHLVTPSIWPVFGAVAAMTIAAGIIFAAHFNNYITLVAGLCLTGFTMYVWWRDVVRESRTPGLHKMITQIGMRYGMALFITSEVMFFVSFFWNYFNYFFFPDKMGTAMAPVWPPMGITTIDPFAIPLFNTMVLLLSGTTITWAHHCLIEGDNRGTVQGLAVTVLLGVEAAAWYWHFVDVVWLFLFVCIYYLGRSAIVAG